jgi:hypothetical protein
MYCKNLPGKKLGSKTLMALLYRKYDLELMNKVNEYGFIKICEEINLEIDLSILLKLYKRRIFIHRYYTIIDYPNIFYDNSIR